MSESVTVACHRLSESVKVACHRLSESVIVACRRLLESVRECHSYLSQIVRAVICEQRAGTSLEWSAPLWERLRLTALLRTGEKLTFCHQAVHCHSKEKKWFENLTVLNCYNINEKVKSVKKGSIIWYRTHQSLSMECTKQSILGSLSSMLTRTGLIRSRTIIPLLYLISIRVTVIRICRKCQRLSKNNIVKISMLIPAILLCMSDLTNVI